MLLPTMLCALGSHTVAAQLSISQFTKFNYKDGLSNDNIKWIGQDDIGYIWIGTENGLNCFNGKEFKAFYWNNPITKLPGNYVTLVKNLGDNLIGICTRQGSQVLNTKTMVAVNYILPDTGVFVSKINSGWDICRLKNERIGITTYTGFYVFNKDGSIYYRYDHYQPGDELTKRILYGQDIFKLGSHQYIIMADEDNYGVYDEQKNEYTHIDQPPYGPFPFFSARKNAVISSNSIGENEFLLLQYKTDTVGYYNHNRKQVVYSKLPFKLFGTISWYSKVQPFTNHTFLLNARTGFYVLQVDKTTGHVSCDNQLLLPELRPFCHFTDREGRLWVGTENGLYMQNLKQPLITPVENNHTKNNNVNAYTSCMLRYKNKLYIGNVSKFDPCLYIADTGTKKIIKKIIFYEPGSQWNEIASMNQYHTDTLWVGTGLGLLWFSTKSYQYGKVQLNDGNTKFGGNETMPLLADMDIHGDAWMADIGTGLAGRYHVASRKFTPYNASSQPNQPLGFIKHIVTDAYGDTWLAGFGITRFKYSDQRFDTLITEFGGPNKMEKNVLSITADSYGSLWIQTANNELVEYKIKEKKMIGYSVADGFPPDVVYALSNNIDKTIWMYQPHKLMRYNPALKNLQIFTSADGLPDDKSIGPTIYYDRELNVHYGIFANHYAIINNNIPTLANAKKINISEVVFNNTQSIANPATIINTSYQKSEVMLRFTCIDFECGKDYLYYYQLDKEAWVFMGNNNELRLGKLAVGNHAVVIRTVDKSGRILSSTIQINVTPPFWRRPWFLFISCLAAACSIWLLYKNRIKSIRRKASVDTQLADMEMKALHSQMNPHFVFNCLGTIKQMVQHGENGPASHYLGKFSRLIRLSLEHSTQAFISLSQNTEYLQLYIEMEKLRFANGFDYLLRMPSGFNADSIQLPPLMIQPLAENAIWHGLKNSRQRGMVVIDFSVTGNKLVCTVTDNGPGIIVSDNAAKLHKSMGLDNIRRRLELLNEKYGYTAQLTIADNRMSGMDETGVTVTLELPYIY